MDEQKEVRKCNQEALDDLRDIIAMALDPGAFQPITSTWNFAVQVVDISSRRMAASNRAVAILNKLVKLMDAEYAAVFAGKAASA